MRDMEYRIFIDGIPRLENMQKGEFTVFCKTLLAEVEEHYKKSEKEKAKYVVTE